MKTLVFAESELAARELCGGARRYTDEVAYATFGEPLTGIADECVMVNVPDDQAKETAVDTFFEVLQEQDPQVVFFEPTRRLKVIVGRLAAREGASVITDVVSFGDEQAKSRYFGGIAMRSTKSLSPIAFYSVPAGVFGEVEPTGTDVVREVAFVEPTVPLECVSREVLPPAKVDLSAAARVVAAGRGFAARDELDLAYEFCRVIDAELGCTRPLTESEDWLPREAYIGVSGLMLTPEVYVGIGVSGQMQHMVGVDRAKVSFAVNKDPHAPIFDKVDYGLVGEITDVLPKINTKLA